MVFLLCVLGAGVVADLAHRRRTRLGRKRYAAAMLVPAALLASALLLLPGGYVLGKIVGRLVMPAGLLWLGLLGGLGVAYVRRSMPAVVTLALVLVAYSAVGSGYLGAHMLAWLERDYAASRPLRERPFEAVFVMGGGITHGPDGDPVLADAGDRVMLAARLYHAGLTPVLVTSGQSYPGAARTVDAATATTTVWRSIGVPEAAIVRIPRVFNSREEIDAYARLTQARGWRRVGLLTSAYHLRRAMALANRRSLRAIPLPADRRGSPAWAGLLSLVPAGEGFRDVGMASWEIAGALAHR